MFIEIEPNVIKSLQDMCLEYVAKCSFKHALPNLIITKENGVDVSVNINNPTTIYDLKKKLKAEHLITEEIWDVVKNNALRDQFEHYCKIMLDCGRLDLSKRSRKIIIYKDTYKYTNRDDKKKGDPIDHYMTPLMFSDFTPCRTDE